MTTKEHILWTLDAHYLGYVGKVDDVDVAMLRCLYDPEGIRGGESTLAFYCGGVEYSTEAELIAAVRERKGKEG